MLKLLLTSIFSLLLCTAVNAQTGGLVYYLKNSGKLVAIKDSADYSMVVLPPDTSVDKTLYVVYEYYKNGKVRFVTNSKKNGINLMYQGQYIAYYPNGKKKAMGTNENGKPAGMEIGYYPNGNLYYAKNYDKVGKIFYSENRDSTGKVLAENGKGSWIIFDDDFKTTIEEGRIDGGKEDGIWHLKKNDSITVENEYNKGDLVYSEYMYKSGKIVFTKVEVNPEFSGGVDEFLRFLARNIRYPAEARDNGTQGKVIVSFLCGSDGKITDVHVVRGIGDGCDEESVRVIKLLPPWKPGYVHGKPVNVAYSVPISFALN